MIKKAISCLLLVLLVFNLIGYRIPVYYAQQETDFKLETKFDRGIYNKKEVFIISIPLNLPYATNWQNYERFDGEVNYNGKIYKYIKRRVFNNQLFLMCMPNKDKMRLECIKEDFFKLSLNKDNDTKSGKAGNSKNQSLKNFTEVYINSKFELSYFRWYEYSNQFYNIYKPKLCASHIRTLTQPPQLG